MKSAVYKIVVVLIVLAWYSPVLAIAGLYLSSVWLVMLTVAVSYKKNKPLNHKKL